MCRSFEEVMQRYQQFAEKKSVGTTCTRLVDELNENLAALDVPEEYEAGAGAPIPIKGGGPAPLDQVKIKGDL